MVRSEKKFLLVGLVFVQWTCRTAECNIFSKFSAVRPWSSLSSSSSSSSSSSLRSSSGGCRSESEEEEEGDSPSWRHPTRRSDPSRYPRAIHAKIQSMNKSLARAVPALAKKRGNDKTSPRAMEASMKMRKIRPPDIDPDSIGFFYGLKNQILKPLPYGKRSPGGRSSVASDTLDELRTLREEMRGLRREMRAIKRSMGVQLDHDDEEEDDDDDDDEADGLSGGGGGGGIFAHKTKRQREFDRLGLEIERWAEKILHEEGTSEADGWSEVKCNKLFQSTFNKKGNIKCYLKWMHDSRGDQAKKDDRVYPCLKIHATLDSPMEDVCAYLADESKLPEYNDLVVKHKDLEDITPHSKICWGLSPQVLFIKPRDFVTFCHHRWLRDGTQVVVNQAVEHKDAPVVDSEHSGKVCRAHALRGANFIKRHPDDPEKKTQFLLVAHGDPGGLAPWACRTAVNAVAPIEPFKLFHKINVAVKRNKSLRNAQPLDHTEFVGAGGRSSQAAGLSQLGYACFWPKGGGLREGFLHQSHPTASENLHSDEETEVEAPSRGEVLQHAMQNEE